MIAHQVFLQTGGVYLLESAPTIDIVPEKIFGQRVCATGKPLGAIFYDHPGGSVARLGVLPTSSTLRVTVKRGQRFPAVHREYHCSTHPTLSRLFLGMAVEQAVSSIVIDPSCPVIRFTVRVDESRPARDDVECSGKGILDWISG
ncbi:MAG: hypothetical protein KDB53_05965 [Planctomycetes bacterium]|nr:hypothetical protein [Planctomycetota bacterium]